jgi:hypothetical protein
MSKPTRPAYKTRNLPAYNEALKRRGSLTIHWPAGVGKTTDWVRKNRVALETDGFPKVCRLVGLTVKADVRAWIRAVFSIRDARSVNTTRFTKIWP